MISSTRYSANSFAFPFPLLAHIRETVWFRTSGFGDMGFFLDFIDFFIVLSNLMRDFALNSVNLAFRRLFAGFNTVLSDGTWVWCHVSIAILFCAIRFLVSMGTLLSSLL